VYCIGSEKRRRVAGSAVSKIDETLDRINVYGNYEPNNCRWAGIKTQNRNVRVRPDSTTGITGVSKTGSGKFMAKVFIGKKAYYSKVYLTLEEAAAARKELERIHWAGDL